MNEITLFESSDRRGRVDGGENTCGGSGSMCAHSGVVGRLSPRGVVALPDRGCPPNRPDGADRGCQRTTSSVWLAVRNSIIYQLVYGLGVNCQLIAVIHGQNRCDALRASEIIVDEAIEAVPVIFLFRLQSQRVRIAVFRQRTPVRALRRQ